MTHRQLTDEWDDYDSMFYNAWLSVSIEPTRYIDWLLVKRLKIDRDLSDMLSELGLGTMPTTTHDLYPRLGQTVIGHGSGFLRQQEGKESRRGHSVLLCSGH